MTNQLPGTFYLQYLLITYRYTLYYYTYLNYINGVYIIKSIMIIAILVHK